MAKRYGKEIWQRYMAKRYGIEIWQRDMAKTCGKEIWQRDMSKTYGKEILDQVYHCKVEKIEFVSFKYREHCTQIDFWSKAFVTYKKRYGKGQRIKNMSNDKPRKEQEEKTINLYYILIIFLTIYF